MLTVLLVGLVVYFAVKSWVLGRIVRCAMEYDVLRQRRHAEEQQVAWQREQRIALLEARIHQLREGRRLGEGRMPGELCPPTRPIDRIIRRRPLDHQSDSPRPA